MTAGILALDYGGTLAGSSPRVTAQGLVGVARAKYGDRLPQDAEREWSDALAEERRAERATATQRPLSAIVSGLLSRHGIDDDGVELTDTLFDTIGDGAPLPEALSVLRWAREAGFDCVLASNTYRTLRARERTLRDAGLLPYFRAVVLSSEIGVRKPHPELYSRVIAAAGVAADRIIFIGDTVEKDVLAPLAAGLYAISLGDGSLAQEIAHPHYLGRIGRLAEVVDVLQRWRSDAA